MSAAKKHADGELQPAIDSLNDAIHDLIDPIQQIIDGRHYQAESLYMQLWDADPADGFCRRNRALSAAAVTWIDALQLRIEIDDAVAMVQPQPLGTVQRLREVTRRQWKPQQTRYINQLADAINQWTKDIDELLNPKPKWTLPAACPACEKDVVYKTKDGERVRQPALQILRDNDDHLVGCECQACKTFWEPHRFQILAGALGCPLPPGVLE